jgi:hypothetical protein
MSRRRKQRPAVSPLPPACGDCRPYDGRWRRGERGGLERCGCARGREIFARSPEGKRAARTSAAELRALLRRARGGNHDGRLAGAGGDE